MLRKRIWLGICAVLFLVLIATIWIYRSAVLGPDFYRQTLVIDSGQARRLGEELEDRYLDAHNTAVRESTWSLEFTDQQLNGWLTSTLARKYPRYQPTQIDNIRTRFEDERIRIAFRVKDAWIPIVVSIDVVPYVTADGNSIAIRLEKICTGVIPLPKKQATDRISTSLSRAGIPVAWTVEKGRPLALLPPDFEMPQGIDRMWRIQNIQIEDGKLILSGTAMDAT